MSSDAIVLERMFRGVGQFYGRCADVSPGGRTLELGGVRAAVVPALPHASIVNCVTYADVAELESRIDELATVYDQTGVHAWAVWTHESDEPARAALDARGFVLDSEPMSMSLDLDGAVEAAAAGGLDWTSDPDPGDVAAVVDPSYGFPPGTFGSGFPELPAEVHGYLARHDGRPAGVVLASDLEGDCGIYLVGTIPEARGKGLSTALMRRALADAALRGCEISSLQASKMGYPMYRRLGYRDLGRAELWELRRGSQG